MPLFRMLALSFALAGIFATFAPPAFSATGAPPSGGGGNVRFRLSADPTTLDWNLAHTSYETPIIMNLMEGLVEEGPDLQPRPALAEKWDISSDGKKYVFHLRKGVKWSDGKALRAQDFVDSWLRALAPATNVGYAYFLFSVVGAEEFHEGKLKDVAQVGIRALNDDQVEVRLKVATPYFLHIPSFWITFPVRADLIAKYGKNWATPGKIATLGPYLLEDWKAGNLIRLKRNPNYYADSGPAAARPERAEAVIEPSDKQARKLFEVGGIDFLPNATTEDVSKYAGDEAGTKILRFPYLSTTYLAFNVTVDPLKYVAVRRALAMAVQRELIPELLNGGEVLARGLVPPGLVGYDYSQSHLIGTPDEAAQELARLGYRHGEKFPKLALIAEQFDGAEPLVKYIAHSYQEVLKVSVDARVVAHGEYQAALDRGRALGSKPLLYIGTWGADIPDPSNFFNLFRSDSGLNFTGWKNAEYDRKTLEAATLQDPQKRTEAYAEAERLLIDRDVAILPLFHRTNTVLARKRVAAVTISPLNYLFLKEVRLAE